MGDQNIGMAKMWWRDYNMEAVMKMHKAWGLAKVMRESHRRNPERPMAPHMGYDNFMADCIKDTRTAGNSGYVRAIAPFWNARDIAFYFWGVSDEASEVAGYKAMMEHYGVDAPSWAWW